MVNRKGAKGRPNKPTYQTSWGEVIDGVYLGKDNCLRIIGQSRPAYSITNDEKMAVVKIRRALREKEPMPPLLSETEWDALPIAEQAAHTSKRMVWMSNEAEHVGIREDPEYTAIIQDPEYFRQRTIHFERERLRELIMFNPRQASIELRYPPLATLQSSRDPEKPKHSLADLGPAALAAKRNDFGKPLAKKSVDNQKRHWREFLQIVGVSHIHELSHDLFQSYLTTIENQKTKPGGRKTNKAGKKIERKHEPKPLSDDSIKNRLTSIKSIIQWGFDTDKPCRDLYRVALEDAQSVFKFRLKTEKAPEKKVPGGRPELLLPEHFHKMLNSFDLRMRAIWLCGLNFCMHSGEVGLLVNTDLDLDKRILDTYRNKNFKPRVAHIWQRTIDAIRAYKACPDYPHSSQYIFSPKVGRNKGQHLTDHAIAQEVRKHREELELPEYVTMEDLRDASYTIAYEVDDEFAKMFAGHTVKDQSKKYVKRRLNPKIIECCEAIENEYFG